MMSIEALRKLVDDYEKKHGLVDVKSNLVPCPDYGCSGCKDCCKGNPYNEPDEWA